MIFHAHLVHLIQFEGILAMFKKSKNKQKKTNQKFKKWMQSDLATQKQKQLQTTHKAHKGSKPKPFKNTSNQGQMRHT